MNPLSVSIKFNKKVNMKFLKLIPFLIIYMGIFPTPNLVYADGNDPNNYKVLSSTNKTFSITNVEFFLREGDDLIKTGEFDKAKKSFDKATCRILRRFK